MYLKCYTLIFKIINLNVVPNFDFYSVIKKKNINEARRSGCSDKMNKRNKKGTVKHLNKIQFTEVLSEF